MNKELLEVASNSRRDVDLIIEQIRNGELESAGKGCNLVAQELVELAVRCHNHQAADGGLKHVKQLAKVGLL